MIENRHITTDQAERVERQAREFERLKPYLVQRWGAGMADESQIAVPARILIPVANGTAEELIRLGA